MASKKKGPPFTVWDGGENKTDDLVRNKNV